MAKTRTIAPTKIADGEYYTLKEFARLTNREEDSVRKLIKKGNRMRKLRHRYFFGSPFILAGELTEFPFTSSGRNAEIFHYDKDGKVTG